VCSSDLIFAQSKAGIKQPQPTRDFSHKVDSLPSYIKVMFDRLVELEAELDAERGPFVQHDQPKEYYEKLRAKENAQLVIEIPEGTVLDLKTITALLKKHGGK
jgi:hypothetical protein